MPTNEQYNFFLILQVVTKHKIKKIYEVVKMFEDKMFQIKFEVLTLAWRTN